MRIPSALLAFALATALVSPVAAAGDDAAQVEQAKMLFNAGAQAYEAGRFATAVQAFQQAYAIAPRPAILFSMAQAERKSYYVDKRPQDLRNAITHYHAYLDQVPTGGRRGDAADALAELEPIAARLSPAEGAGPATPPAEQKTRLMVTSQTSGAKAALDGGTPEDVPLIEEVTPGKHHVRIWADGYFDEERDAIAAQGSMAALDVPLREKPALLSVTLDRSASISVDGRPVATTPLAQPLEVPSGTHVVTITKNGYKAFSREVTLAHGGSATIAAKLETSGQRTAAWIVLGTAGAAAIAGGVFTGLALAEQSNAQSILDAKNRGPIMGSDLSSYNSDVSARDQWRTVAIASFGGAAGLLLVGGVLYFFDQPHVEAGPPPSETPRPAPKKEPMEMGVLPWIAPNGAGAAVGGRF
ncbi:MAG TPA: PEGA domain-containing protein [Polyangiaceae bacterium]